MLSSTLQSLEQLKIADGSNLSGLDAYIAGLDGAGIALKQLPTTGQDYFKGSVQQPYLSKLIESITKRFEDKSLMCAFQIFDPTTLPSSDSGPSEFQQQYLERLATHYLTTGFLAEPQDCLSKWSHFKQFLKQKENDKLKNHSDVCQVLCSDSTITQIIKIISKYFHYC